MYIKRKYIFKDKGKRTIGQKDEAVERQKVLSVQQTEARSTAEMKRQTGRDDTCRDNGQRKRKGAQTIGKGRSDKLFVRDKMSEGQRTNLGVRGIKDGFGCQRKDRVGCQRNKGRGWVSEEGRV